MSHTSQPDTRTVHPEPAPAADTKGDAEPEQRKSWALLAVALAAQILVVLDISVVNTALPSIGTALNLSSSQLQWVVTAYLMMSGGCLLLGGRIADLLSRRGVFLTGLVLFTAASAASGLSNSGSQLIAARSVQGLSAALLTPAALSLIMTTYSGAQRKSALAMWGAVGSLGVAAGVLFGGALTTAASWQAIFWVNVPIGAIALIAGHRIIAHDPTPRPTVRDFDFPGAAAVISGLVTLIYGITGTADHGWWSVPTVTAFAISAILLTMFLKLEKRAAKPLFPPHIWKLKPLVSGTAVMLGVSGILVGAVFLTSIFLQTVLGYSALEAGLTFLPFALALTIGTVLARHLLSHVSPRALATVGLLIAVAACCVALHSQRLGIVADRCPSRARVARVRARHGLRAGIGDVDDRNPGIARRCRIWVPDDRTRNRRRSRRRHPVRGRDHGRHAHDRGRCGRRVLRRVHRCCRHGRI